MVNVLSTSNVKNQCIGQNHIEVDVDVFARHYIVPGRCISAPRRRQSRYAQSIVFVAYAKSAGTVLVIVQTRLCRRDDEKMELGRLEVKNPDEFTVGNGVCLLVSRGRQISNRYALQHDTPEV